MTRENAPRRGARVSPEQIVVWLNRLVKAGVSAATLEERAPELVEAICGQDESRTTLENAIEAEELIARAVDALGGDLGESMRVFLGMKPGLRRTSVGFRQEAAGQALGKISADAFRQKRHRESYMKDLGVEIYKLMNN